jgi:hypothetical protein
MQSPAPYNKLIRRTCCVHAWREQAAAKSDASESTSSASTTAAAASAAVTALALVRQQQSLQPKWRGPYLAELELLKVSSACSAVLCVLNASVNLRSQLSSAGFQATQAQRCVTATAFSFDDM